MDLLFIHVNKGIIGDERPSTQYTDSANRVSATLKSTLSSL